MLFLIITTYALSMAPVALCMEELIPSNNSKFYMYSILIRTALVLSTFIVGLSIPFFGESLFLLSLYTTITLLPMELSGDVIDRIFIYYSLIIPCACFLSIWRGKVSRFQSETCLQ
ncbi:hypothetical protein Lal_00028414 [Lupinus albus]|nr:hypothetical protein Lal_00028414 [Lupinus albus]